jgi:diphosphomevalonate decarboxylase
VTLGGLTSTARVTAAAQHDDRISFDRQAAEPRVATPLRRFLDLLRHECGADQRLNVDLHTNFPVAAGIASSASTFAALTVAVARWFDASFSDSQLSVLARRGSGSAARSLFAGYVEWSAGEADDGSDSFAYQIAPPAHWPLSMIVAVTDPSPKKVGSREAMAQAVRRSPFFAAWLETHDLDLNEIRTAITARDLTGLGVATERNCLKMHAVSLASDPPLLYWRPATLAVIDRVRQLREAGTEAYFTIDAGPQVKVLCSPENGDAVAAAVEAVPGVQQVLRSYPGGAPTLEAV